RPGRGASSSGQPILCRPTPATSISRLDRRLDPDRAGPGELELCQKRPVAASQASIARAALSVEACTSRATSVANPKDKPIPSRWDGVSSSRAFASWYEHDPDHQ